MKLNHDLGTDDEIAMLVQRIKGFNFDEAGVNEMLSLARALHVVADDITSRHDRIRELETTLKGKLQVADVVAEVNLILSKSKTKKSWLPWK